MNWLLIAVICIIAWNVVRGYTRGVLRMVYSLAAWIVMLAASTMAAPYVRDQILSQTGIEPVILNGIEKQIAAQGQKATGDFDMANILLQQSGAYDTISAQLTNAIMTGLSFFIVIFFAGNSGIHSPSHYQKNRKGARYWHCEPDCRLCSRFY